MTGKDMLQGIQNLDAELIEESEFGTFGKGKAGGFGKKKLLLPRSKMNAESSSLCWRSNKNSVKMQSSRVVTSKMVRPLCSATTRSEGIRHEAL